MYIYQHPNMVAVTNEGYPDHEQYTALEGYNGGLLESSASQSEEDVSANHMADMIKAIECKEFRDEAEAILSWFRVVSHAERAITLIRLRECLSNDPYRIILSANQKQQRFEHWLKHDTTPLDVKGWMAKHDEKKLAENPDKFMEVMIQASQRPKFREETDTAMA
jgi:hypothetical protein